MVPTVFRQGRRPMRKMQFVAQVEKQRGHFLSHVFVLIGFLGPSILAHEAVRFI
jgi:hypothetical protein